MRPAGCQRVGHPGGPIRVSQTGLEFKVSRLARAPGICETGPAGIGKTHTRKQRPELGFLHYAPERYRWASQELIFVLSEAVNQLSECGWLVFLKTLLVYVNIVVLHIYLHTVDIFAPLP